MADKIYTGSRALLACEMIRKELNALMEKQPFPGEVVWMEKGLHEYPDRLRTALQREIDARDGKIDYIVLVYGLCGNGIIGLKAEKSRLVIPLFDDCIRALLSLEANEEIEVDPRALYYTDEWMDTGVSMLMGAETYVERYGEKKALKIIKAMLKNYKRATFLETGLYNIESAAEKIRPTTEKIGLTIDRAPASFRVYDALLSGRWDKEFLVTEPGETVTEQHFAGRARCRFVDPEAETYVRTDAAASGKGL